MSNVTSIRCHITNVFLGILRTFLDLLLCRASVSSLFWLQHCNKILVCRWCHQDKNMKLWLKWWWWNFFRLNQASTTSKQVHCPKFSEKHTLSATLSSPSFMLRLFTTASYPGIKQNKSRLCKLKEACVFHLSTVKKFGYNPLCPKNEKDSKWSQPEQLLIFACFQGFVSMHKLDLKK